MSTEVPAARGFRPELHGLRGTAIALVVVYHVFIGRVSGGVDVFLFLSAFLLTGSVANRIEAGLPVRPIASWVRTVKRLLAPAALVVLVTLLGVRLWLPPSTWYSSLTDAAGSLLQVENWVLAGRSVDYSASTAGASVFQHFWSLSVQGQIFLLWPLLMAAGGILSRRTGLPVRRVLIALFSVVLGGSLTWSIISTESQQTLAYFDTSARAWEFAAGSLLALLLPSLEARRDLGVRTRVALGWIGLAGLVSCGALLDVQGAFPGWIAAWPLGCAALVLVAGSTGRAGSADRLLSTSPAVFLGNVAYCLYLVHWPMLILWLGVSGKERAGILDGAVLIVLSLVLAQLLTRLVDDPVRRWSWANASALRSGGVAAAALVIGLAPVMATGAVLEHRREEAQQRASVDNPGARVLSDGFRPDPDADPDAAVLPAPQDVGRDWVAEPPPCTGDLAPQDPILAQGCGLTEGDEDDPVLVIVGSSRMQQHSGAILPLAKENGWRVMTLWRNSCPYSPGLEARGGECTAFNAAAEAFLLELRPDAVATTTTLVPYEGAERPSPGVAQAVGRLTDAGIPVLAFRDQPRLEVSPPGCVEEHGADAERCTARAEDMFASRRPDGEILAQDGVIGVDMTDRYCPEGICRPVIGNVAVFLDANHVSATYTASTAGELQRQLDSAGWRW